MAGKDDGVAYVVHELTRMREHHGLSQSELDDALGIADGQISKWERGVRRPTLDSAFAWAGALGLTLVLRDK